MVIHETDCLCYDCKVSKTLSSFTQHLRDLGMIPPNVCPVCNNRFYLTVNDKEICDTCFIIEARQRMAFSIAEGTAIDHYGRFTDWFLEHTDKSEDE